MGERTLALSPVDEERRHDLTASTTGADQAADLSSLFQTHATNQHYGRQELYQPAAHAIHLRMRIDESPTCSRQGLGQTIGRAHCPSSIRNRAVTGDQRGGKAPHSGHSANDHPMPNGGTAARFH